MLVPHTASFGLQDPSVPQLRMGTGMMASARVGILVWFVVATPLVIATLLLFRGQEPFQVGGVVIAVLLATFVAAGVRVCDQWNRMALLRLGNFRRMEGPGFFWIFPIIDATPYVVDLRIVTYDVPKQESLTRDNIPVTVDAIVYYKVADPEAAVLKIEDYHRATQLGAQTLLRDLIGKVHLDELLSERERLSGIMRQNLDEMTDEWGIKVQDVELKEVVIAKHLQDAIAREPAAEREKRARLRLAEAELLAAQTIYDAAQIYERDPVALQLRAMNMLYEMCMEGTTTVVFVPTETRQGMPMPLGVYGIMERLIDMHGPERKPEGPDTAPKTPAEPPEAGPSSTETSEGQA